MKTVEIELYHFDELPSKAQERAISDWAYNSEYAWGEENRESMEAFCRTFDVKVRDWSYGGRDEGVYGVEVSGPEANWQTGEEITGLRLRTWILNNYGDVLTERKPIGPYPYKRRSRIMEQETCCPWTGYCMDDTLLRPIREFIRKPEPGMDWEELVNDCLYAWVHACSADMESIYEEDYVQEDIEANDVLFTRDGEVWS